MGVSPGEYRYVKSLGSPSIGHEIMTVMRSTSKWQNRSLWLCLYPDGTFRIVSMINRRVQREPQTTTVYDSVGLRSRELVWDDVPRQEAEIVKAFDADKLEEETAYYPEVPVPPRLDAGQGGRHSGAVPGSAVFGVIWQQVTRGPRWVWQVTEPLGHRSTRVVSLSVGALIFYRASATAFSKLGVFAVIVACWEETLKSYTVVAEVYAEVLWVYETFSATTGDMWTRMKENRLVTVGLLYLIYVFWGSQAPKSAPAGLPLPPPFQPPKNGPTDPRVPDALVENLLNEQRELRRHVDKLQDELAAARSPADEAAGGAPAPAAAAPKKKGPEADMVAKLIERLDSLEEVVKDDSAAIGRLEAAPPGVAPFGVGPLAGTVTPTGAAAPGSPGLIAPGTKALAVMPKVVESAEESSIEGIVARLERATQSPHDAFLRQLRRYREIPPQQWPMPPGFAKRLAPTYLATVYQNSTAVQYAKQWLRDHSLLKCVPAQEMISIMEAVDDSILHDERDVINSLAFEKLIRRAYGLERCYEDVLHEIDWKRPDGKKGWVSKCKWDLCDRYDTRGANFRSSRVPEADEEAKQAMERDASFQKWYNKSAATRAADAD